MNDAPRRSPAVAGLFYPQAATALRSELTRLLAPEPQHHGPRPRALIVPHAGYVYSGAAAARAYARLMPWRASIKRVVVLGPPHRVPVRGVAASSAAAFVTPLGSLPVDRDAVTRLLADGQVEMNDIAHRPEHSIEVQLPFVQTVLDASTLLPLLVSEVDAPRLAALIAPWWEAQDTLLIVSTDLSHFLDYDAAQAHDRDTDSAIMALDATRIGPQDACGCRALNGLLQLASERTACIERLALYNSGDTAAGTRERVVGYAAYVLH